MKSKSESGGVVRRSISYYPYNTGSPSKNDAMKEDVVRLGVELSLRVVESMFLLSDDVRTMLSFCFKICRDPNNPPDPILERLLRVMHYVYSKYIKPKKRVFRDDGNSVQWSLIATTWENFCHGILLMIHFDKLLKRKKYSFDDRLLSSAIAKYKQEVLRKLDDKLRSAKDVSEANGFSRETIEPVISDLWKSLFDKEPKDASSNAEVIRRRVINDLFTLIREEPFHREVEALRKFIPNILGEDFSKQQLQDEVVILGVELSFYVAESMFLLCDDIRSMRCFCYKLWNEVQRDLSLDSLVVQRLFCVMHYVYSTYIKHKNGVFRSDGKSAQWRLITTTWENFADGIKGLHRLVLILGGEGRIRDGRKFTSSIEESLKKVDDTLRSAKDVSEANGFARNVMESSILDLWKSVFDKESKKVIKHEMFCELFLPVCFQAPPC